MLPSKIMECKIDSSNEEFITKNPYIRKEKF